MSRLLPLLLLLFPLALPAGEVYRTVDEDGNVVYTDQPPSDDAEPVDLDPVTTVPAYEDDATGNGSGGAEVEATPSYAGLSILYPTPDQAIRHNGGQVPFEVGIRPDGVELDESHRVEIVVDQAVVGSGRPPTVTAGPIDRGPHDAFARIVDAGGNTLRRSQSVNFFLLRASAATP